MKHAFAALLAALIISLSPCRTAPVKTTDDLPPANVAPGCPQDTAPDCAATAGMH